MTYYTAVVYVQYTVRVCIYVPFRVGRAAVEEYPYNDRWCSRLCSSFCVSVVSLCLGTMWSGNCTLKLRRSAGIVPPPRAVHWPVYLLWWSYALLLAISPLPALAQEKVLTDKDVILPNGCLWNNVTFELNCSQLGLTRIPPIDLSISETATQL